MLYLANPIIVFFVFFTIGAMLLVRKKTDIGLWLVLSSAAWIFLISTSPIPKIVTQALESKYPVYSPTGNADQELIYILVLGGGFTNDESLPATQRLSSKSLNRVIEGMRIYKLFPRAKFIVSGGQGGRGSLVQVAAQAAVNLGCLPGDTLYNAPAADTYEEIKAYVRRFGFKQKLIIVTSAIHMSRAMTICKRVGLDAAAAPTDYLVKVEGENLWFDLKPSVQKIEMSQNAIHEYLGIFETLYLDTYQDLRSK